MIYFYLTLFIILVMGLWSLNFFGLPGNWLIVLVAALWIWIGPEQFRFSWIVVAVLILLSIIGEAIEFLASVLGTKKLGGSSRSATFSVIGSILGSIIGAFLGLPIPIPIVGMLIGSILFACIGAMLGAMLGEQTHGPITKETVKIGAAAFAGRLLGTIGKLIVGTTMLILAVAAPFIF